MVGVVDAGFPILLVEGQGSRMTRSAISFVIWVANGIVIPAAASFAEPFSD
jgi:hypothetical protein